MKAPGGSPIEKNVRKRGEAFFQSVSTENRARALDGVFWKQAQVWVEIGDELK